MNNKNIKPKVIFLGVDGASWKVIDEICQDGSLPNFQKLKKSGSAAILKSTYPPSSPPAWSSMFTGVTPGKHNIFDFIQRKKSSYFIDPIFSTDLKVPTLWQYLTQFNKKIIALNIPFSYPLNEINGIMTCGLGAPSKKSDFTYPKNFSSYVNQKYPDFDIDFEEQSFNLPNDKDRIISKVKLVTHNQIKLAKDLFINQKWDLFALVLRSPDVIQHFFMNQPDILKEIYTQVDDVLGWFMENTGSETTLITASDHGFKKIKTKFYLNNWLKEEGFLKVKSVNSFKINADYTEKILIKAGLRKLVYYLKQSPILETVMKIIPTSSRVTLATRADWKNTKLYYMGISNNGLVFINKIGREPVGIVNEEDVYLLYRDFKNKLSKLTYKSQKVIDEIIFAEDVYTYNNQRIGPDIIVSLRDDFAIEDGISENGLIFENEKLKIGNHDPNGIFAIFKQNKKYKLKNSYSIYDITPTLLSLLGIDSKFDFDGTPII